MNKETANNTRHTYKYESSFVLSPNCPKKFLPHEFTLPSKCSM